MKVGLVCPCRTEFTAITETLRFESLQSLDGRLVARRNEEHDLVAVLSGFGKTRAASATQWLIDMEKADLLLDVGAAGALDPSLGVFAMALGDSAYEYDWMAGPQPDGHDELRKTFASLNAFSDEQRKVLDEWLEAAKNDMGLAIHVGRIAAGERNVDNATLRDGLHHTTGALACNWETSAVLLTAAMAARPAMSFRVITDSADGAMQVDLRANWSEAMEKLAALIGHFVDGEWLTRLGPLPPARGPAV